MHLLNVHSYAERQDGDPSNHSVITIGLHLRMMMDSVILSHMSLQPLLQIN